MKCFDPVTQRRCPAVPCLTCLVGLFLPCYTIFVLYGTIFVVWLDVQCVHVTGSSPRIATEASLILLLQKQYLRYVCTWTGCRCRVPTATQDQPVCPLIRDRRDGIIQRCTRLGYEEFRGFRGNVVSVEISLSPFSFPCARPMITSFS